MDRCTCGVGLGQFHKLWCHAVKSAMPYEMPPIAIKEKEAAVVKGHVTWENSNGSFDLLVGSVMRELKKLNGKKVEITIKEVS